MISNNQICTVLAIEVLVMSCYFQNTLAKLLIEVLCLGKDSPDALRLLHYKAPKTAKAVSTCIK